jgi:hypothetical protein
MRPYLQNNWSKKSGSVTSVLECLTRKCEALGLNTNTAQKKKKERKKGKKRPVRR